MGDGSRTEPGRNLVEGWGHKLQAESAAKLRGLRSRETPGQFLTESSLRKSAIMLEKAALGTQGGKVNIGSSWDAGLAPQALWSSQDESFFMRQGHFSSILSDMFLQAATAGSSVQMWSERHPSTSFPTPQMGRAHSQKELLGWGGGSSLMALASCPSCTGKNCSEHLQQPSPFQTSSQGWRLFQLVTVSKTQRQIY